MSVTYTVPSNSIQTNKVGWPFDDNDETWIVPANITVSSATTYGFAQVDTFTGDTLDNFGTVETYAQVAAVFFNANSGSATVKNEAGGIISGARNGIDFLGNGNETLTNLGTILGNDNNGVYFGGHTSGVSVVNYNHGYIFGPSYGVENASGVAGGTIDNFGDIVGGSQPPPDNPSYQPAAISLFMAQTLVTEIINETGGTIDGAVDAIYAHSGAFKLINHGYIYGNIVNADGGSDVIMNGGKINGVVYLDGDSIFRDVHGGTSKAIHVGGGNSTITGGHGPDHFVFDSAITTQVTTITNFQHGIDKIVLSESQFPTLHGRIHHDLRSVEFHVGAVAHKLSQHIVYDQMHGILYYDPDGSAGPQIKIADFTNHSIITNADILIGA